jgi:hypothetical protein
MYLTQKKQIQRHSCSWHLHPCSLPASSCSLRSGSTDSCEDLVCICGRSQSAIGPYERFAGRSYGRRHRWMGVADRFSCSSGDEFYLVFLRSILTLFGCRVSRDLLVYRGSVAVDDSFGPLFRPVSTRSFHQLWDSIRPMN